MDITVQSQSWTGRAPWAGTPLDVVWHGIRALLYPSYDCTQCVGQDAWEGCYCAYYGAIGPCADAGRIRHTLRRLAERWLGIVS